MNEDKSKNLKAHDQNDSDQTLTTRQGHPVTNNQNIRTVGNRGPATLENYDFIEKMSHFDREKIPERIVHARGAGAHGYFETYGTVGDEPVSKYTRAKVFQEKGKQTPVFVRFSTVVNGKHSPETVRDPRGFAIKFYTEDGIWDLVGNNIKIFFIRDAMKFPDMIHAFRPDPVTNIQDSERFFDFCANSPESFHMVTFIYSPWGIPANYRMMQGSGVNTYRWINDKGEAVLVKYHWEPKQEIKNLTVKEANEIQATNFSHATQDLYEAIEHGDYPEWELFVQIMSDDAHPELDFDPLDDTKLWPNDQFPWLPVGKLVLNKNPENYFTEVEQSAFGTGVLVDGLDFSDDKMLQGRTFSYSDTQRYRLGANYLQIPINAAKKHVATNQEGGSSRYENDKGPKQNPHINYEPSILGGLEEAEQIGKEHSPRVEGNLVRKSIDRNDNTKQAGETYRWFEDWEKDELISNLVGDLSECDKRIQDKMVALAESADEEYGRRLREGLANKVKDGSSRNPLGNKDAEKAPDEAIEKGQDAEPY
ncbi:catalase [Virgibacillus alimentarius]|uniref:Catalase n=1 Tax=Virgibacillus alimentarius TaxID=698769 RepID=A0ABS4S983_9BACI|nr:MULTISPECIES: catalase [Virgibacillus]MBP2257540.1 catalase [Virgibacillus alimentarius]HLR68892.1 catalase [Virgibacillus sp.]